MKISINAKCSDLCFTSIYNSKGDLIMEHDGYVPDFMPDEHYGDYVMLDIDVKTGKTLHWTATKEQVLNYIKENKEK